MLLKEPLQIKNKTLQNRIVMPPMARECSEDGKVPEDLIDYYKQRANSTGLIIVEHEYVSEEGRASPKQLSFADDSVIDSYRLLTEAVHSEGSCIIAQINHAGKEAKSYNKFDINTMSNNDIEHVKNAFIDAAKRTENAGFDGVEIHAAHGYFLSQTYSPYTNKRTDEYGGSLENRLRLTNEIIKGVREAVSEDYIIAIRFGAYDYMEGGSKMEDIPFAVKSFEDSGADLIDISGGLCRYSNPNSKDPGWFKELSKIAKDSSDVPIILTGGVKKARDAERLLKDETCDLIGIGRAMLMDAEWSRKALEKLENIQD